MSSEIRTTGELRVEPIRMVAANVRRIREARGLTLSQLATRSGVSKAALSKLELATANPTLDTLTAIASALSVRVEELIAPGAESVVRVVRRDEGRDITDSATSGRLVDQVRLGGVTVEVHDLIVTQDQEETSATHGHGSFEQVYVLDGEVEVGPLESSVRLCAGDYAAYPADRMHRYRGAGSGAARILVFLTLP